MYSIQPDLEWYAATSEKKGISTRCPFATVQRCPRYFESVSLLSDAGRCSKLSPVTHDAVLKKWMAHELWPVSGETATSISGRHPGNCFSNFCPEVAFDTFRLFGSTLIEFYDEIDRAARERQLEAKGEVRAGGDWRWNWEHVEAMHYSDCPVYARLRHDGPAAINSSIEQEGVAALCESAGSTASQAEGHIERIFVRLPLVIRQLRQRHGDRSTLDIDDEYDVQDLLHSLLRLFFDDIRPEEYAPSYAGGASRIDFLLKDESCAIEIKMARKGLSAKQLGEQLIVDMERYRVHPKCRKLYCLVYDPEHKIDNPRGFEGDLSAIRDGLDVKVFVVPK